MVEENRLIFIEMARIVHKPLLAHFVNSKEEKKIHEKYVQLIPQLRVK